MKKLDNYGTEMIPIRLLMSIAIISAITAMLAYGYINLSVTMSENNIQNEFNTLQSKLNVMVASGVARDLDQLNSADGTKRTHTFDLPSNIDYMAFGVDPDLHNTGGLSTNLTENGAIFVYKVSGGNKHITWLSTEDFKFREGLYNNSRWEINQEDQGYIINDSGSITLTFELVTKNDEEFILIQQTDNFDV